MKRNSERQVWRKILELLGGICVENTSSNFEDVLTEILEKIHEKSREESMCKLLGNKELCEKVSDKMFRGIFEIISGVIVTLRTPEEFF